MYVNANYQRLLDIQGEVESEKLKTLLAEIGDFFQKINKKLDQCTRAYEDNVVAILNQFPIKIATGLNETRVFYVNSKQAFDVNEIITALEAYIAKFESIEYLDFLSEESRNVVFVGPNGCGKTTLLRKLKQDTQGANIQYFSADRALLVSDRFHPKRAYDAFIKDFNESYQQSTDVDYDFQGSKIVEQFDFFINLLERERNEENEKRVYNGPTEKIINKWKELVKDRELFFEHGLCVRPIGGEKYLLKYLSTGEKSILYFLIGILLQDEKDFYFIDEPENNLNPAIVSKLWDFIERERPNSVFVYLTHDSDFVASRINAKIYWIKKYNGKKWEWQQLQENKDLPQNLMIELVGSREPVLFCESNNEYKYDSKFFKLMFPEFKVVSSNGCDQVQAMVKAYKAVGLPQMVYGIVDCDYRMDDYLDSLSTEKIYHIPFFEIENLLISEKILKPMVEKYSKEENKSLVIDNIKKKITQLFVAQKDSWVAKHVAFDLRDKFDYRGRIKNLESLSEFKAFYEAERKSNDEIDIIAQKYTKLFDELVEENNYDKILRHLDYKGILTQCQHILKFGKGAPYSQQVFLFLNSADGDAILAELRKDFFPNIIA